jgi:hypothetical protein
MPRDPERKLRLFAEDLASTGRLRPDVSIPYAADIIWSMNAPEHYLLLLEQRGWSLEEFEGWLATPGRACCWRGSWTLKKIADIAANVGYVLGSAGESCAGGARAFVHHRDVRHVRHLFPRGEDGAVVAELSGYLWLRGAVMNGIPDDSRTGVCVFVAPWCKIDATCG